MFTSQRLPGSGLLSGFRGDAKVAENLRDMLDNGTIFNLLYAQFGDRLDCSQNIDLKKKSWLVK